MVKFFYKRDTEKILFQRIIFNQKFSSILLHYSLKCGTENLTLNPKNFRCVVTFFHFYASLNCLEQRLIYA
jgi:hypothetical protein